MKRKIRRGVWESNSSTEHVFTMMMKDDYKRWQSSDLYFYKGGYDYQYKNDIQPVKGGLYTKDEVLNFIKNSKWFSEEELNEYDEDDIDFYLDENGFISSAFYNEDERIGDSFVEEFNTPNGETVIAFGGIMYD